MIETAQCVAAYRRMVADDLDAVMTIENKVYPYPWTRGNFNDSLNAGYHSWIMECADEIVGYGVVMIAADEAHLLNLSIAAGWQGQGLGRQMLKFLVKLARDSLARRIYLEVRPSNVAGRSLYADAGFTQIAIRRDYYPAGPNREDAVIMEMQIG
jgi:ribosomal-protein-alanine N-acetyltransferase